MASVLREYARSVADCQVGFNAGTAALAPTVATYGGTLIRAQFGWETVEDYTTGTLALTTAQNNLLTACVTSGLTPIILAAYGPPWVTLTPLTVATTTAAGAYTIPVVESTGYIDPPYCLLEGPSGKVTTLGDNFFGCVIDSVGTNTVTLSSATNVTLTAGTKLGVQRRRYPAIGTSSTSDANALAYVRYATFLANAINSAGLTGYVELWNEPVWGDDFWNIRARYYDNPAGAGLASDIGLLKSIQSIVLAASPIANVKFIGGGSDLTVTGGVLYQTGIPSPADLASYWGDAIHPYGPTPEWHSWYFSSGCTTAPIDALWAGSNYNGLASLACTYAAANGGAAPKIAATECGTLYSGTGKAATNARYLRRRVASLWGNGVSLVTLYDLSNNSGDPFDVVTQGSGAIALPLMTQKLNELGGAGGSSALVPTVTVPGSLTWDVMKVGVYGAHGAATMLWQRTAAASGWETMTRPATIPVMVTPPAGQAVLGVYNLETGGTVTFTGASPTLQVGDDILLVRTGPTPTRQILTQTASDLENGVMVQASKNAGVVSILVVNYKYRKDHLTSLTITLPASVATANTVKYFLIDAAHSDYLDQGSGDGTLQQVTAPTISAGTVTLLMLPRSVHLLEFSTVLSGGHWGIPL